MMRSQRLFQAPLWAIAAALPLLLAAPAAVASPALSRFWEPTVAIAAPAAQQASAANTRQPPLKGRVLDLRRDRLATAVAKRYASRLRQEGPRLLYQFLHYELVRREDSYSKLLGVRIRPNKMNARDFHRLGLRSGDVVTAVNGMRLNSVATLWLLYKDSDTLLGATDASARVLRQQQVINIRWRLR